MSQLPTWENIIDTEKSKPYFQNILSTLATLHATGKTIYPPTTDIFNAFKYTPISILKVILIGQDPYHQPGQAHGLCFSVAPGITPPPSLKNIYKALAYDLKLPIPNHGCLTTWAKQGVLLLNTVLTVEHGQAHSHSKLGWTQFTDHIIATVNAQVHQPIIYLLWGNHAIKKYNLIQNPLHKALTAPHPSPLSAHRGFLTCRHFSQANAWLASHSVTPIDWKIPISTALSVAHNKG